MIEPDESEPDEMDEDSRWLSDGDDLEDFDENEEQEHQQEEAALWVAYMEERQ